MMQLNQIRPSKSSDKVYLKFDDGSYLPFKIDDIITYKVKTGLIDNYDFLCELSLKFLINNYALRQIAISPKIRAILLPKLKNQVHYYTHKYSFPSLNSDQIIDDTLNYLDQKGWLDSHNYAQFLLKKHSKKSKRYLEQMFSHYSLDKTILNNNDKNNIKILLQKKINKLSKPMDFKTKNKLMQSLSQKGFAYSDIKSVIDEILSVG